jgi:hypothetical protein
MIPFRITVQLLSEGPTGSEVAGSWFEGLGPRSIPGNGSLDLSVESVARSGPVCYGQGNDATGFDAWASLGPTSWSVSYGFFIITDLYGPDAPASERAVMDDAGLTVPVAQTEGYQSVSATITSAQGPGIQSTDNGWAFALDGDTPAVSS